MAMPRPLTAREQEVLEFLVSVDGPASEDLRRQASTAWVTDECHCGCGAISLEVDRTQAQSAEVHAPITTYNDPADPGETRWLLLWLDRGWISGIEIGWISDEAPRGLPSVRGFGPPLENLPGQ